MVTALQKTNVLEAMLRNKRLEVHRGQPREKPSMSFQHNRVYTYVGIQLGQQLDPSIYQVRINGGRVRRLEETYYIPDVFVFPMAYYDPDKDQPGILEIYDQPIPLVVEVWSPSTGGYDVNEKLPEYRRRGDLEIWRIHPFQKVLYAWRRRADGEYDEIIFRGGTVEPVALSGVVIDLDVLFNL